MDEMLYYAASSLPVKVELQPKLGYQMDANTVELTLKVIYLKDSAELMHIQVQNLFELPGLREFPVEDHLLKLPSAIITLIVSLALSHTRALLAVNVAGTPLEEVLLAVVDAEDVAKRFFPYMF